MSQISHEIFEDLDIMDIEFKRWRSRSYRLRQDEVLEVVELLNALCLAVNNGCLVYGPSYATDAAQLRKIVWTSSDDEPILPSGQRAFADDSVLKKAWLHSQAMTLKRDEMDGFITELETSKQPFQFHRERLIPSDLRRFHVGNYANDELINIYVAALNYPVWMPEASDEVHIGSLLHLPPAPRDYIIFSTFFYPKLRQLAQLMGSKPLGHPELQESIERILRWFKVVGLDNVRRLFIPIHQKEESHWLLVLIFFDHKAVVFFDSWGPNQRRFTKDCIVHPEIYSDCLVLAHLMIVHSKGPLKTITGPDFDRTKWVPSMARVPPQSNGVDCGFCILTILLQMLPFNSVNGPNCPTIATIHGSTMHYTRVSDRKSVDSSAGPSTFTNSEGLTSGLQTSHPRLEAAFEFKPTTGIDKTATILVEHLAPDNLKNNTPVNDSPVASSVDGEDLLTSYYPLEATIEHLSPNSMNDSPVASSVYGEDLLPLLGELSAYDNDKNISKVVVSRPTSSDQLLQKKLPPWLSQIEEIETRSLLPDETYPLPPPHRLSTPPKQAEQDISEVAFACRCGDCGPDWTVFERGLVVVQCEDCKAWSHMSCQRYGRASKLRKKEAFICDYCMAPSKTLLEKQNPRPRAARNIVLIVGRGALAKWGKYHYPVVVLWGEDAVFGIDPLGVIPRRGAGDGDKGASLEEMCTFSGEDILDRAAQLP
ncbi:hypothetical protein C8R43DRAFT_1142874 [Mycena crocata]|nr:hypothetical protein C8R43DRAFT_1142874 [Mycena crocata]